MSEFSKNLRLNNLHEKHAVQEPFRVVERAQVSKYLQATKYEVTAGAYQTILINEDLIQNDPKAFEYIISNTKRNLIEYMFGEFRKPILDIRVALFNRNYELAEELLSKLETQMFE